MRGDVDAKHNLGAFIEVYNVERSRKLLMSAAMAGHDASLKKIRDGYSNGFVTKDDFEKALRSHKEATDEAKSEQREVAAAYYRHIIPDIY